MFSAAFNYLSEKLKKHRKQARGVGCITSEIKEFSAVMKTTSQVYSKSYSSHGSSSSGMHLSLCQLMKLSIPV